jgi:O-antigen ligase
MLYTVLSRIAFCVVVALLLAWSLIPTFFSVPTADMAHPDTLRLNEKVLHVSTFSHWVFTGSFIVASVAILCLVGLCEYYRATGVAVPALRNPFRKHAMTQLNLNSD